CVARAWRNAAIRVDGARRSDPRLSAALAAIDAANARDPNSVALDGGTEPAELVYGRRMSETLARRSPGGPAHGAHGASGARLRAAHERDARAACAGRLAAPADRGARAAYRALDLAAQ